MKRVAVNEGRGLRSLGIFLGGVAVGIVGTLFFDPISGARRRAYLRDKSIGFKNDAITRANRIGRDLRNRITGLEAKTARIMKKGETVDDQVLIARVRSKFGRKVSHPKAIEIIANDGVVTLCGPILASEVAGLVSSTKKVRGVKEVINQLDVHETAEHISSLQGEGKNYLRH